jgi:pSer/pThr/pTyr-binding forkhead associated (FHA) protein
MRVKLRILHGKLQNKEGGAVCPDVKIRGPRFVIGSADDCSMCCRSRSVSPHHCEVRIEPNGAVVQDLDSDGGTFVNDQPVKGVHPLQAGDILRVGRLDFEVLIDDSAAAHQEQLSPESEKKSEQVGQRVCKLLDEADEEDRIRRLRDPELRYFHVEQIPKEEADPEPQQPAAEEPPETAKKKKKKPRKKKPGKLPAPPPITGENTTEAAEELLRRMLKSKKDMG